MEMSIPREMTKNAAITKENMNTEVRSHSSPNAVNEKILNILKRNGYNFGVRFPCSILKGLYEMLEGDIDIKGITVTREEEGVGISAGAYLAGKRPFMLIQSSGLGNSFNAIASLLLTYKIPVLILASFRGYYNEKILAQIPLGRALPGMLKAMGIPFLILENTLEPLETFCNKILRSSIPFVVLLSPELYNCE